MFCDCGIFWVASLIFFVHNIIEKIFEQTIVRVSSLSDAKYSTKCCLVLTLHVTKFLSGVLGRISVFWCGLN